VCGGCEPAALGKKWAFVSFGLQKKEYSFFYVDIVLTEKLKF
jgi:hypothetical protein